MFNFDKIDFSPYSLFAICLKIKKIYMQELIEFHGISLTSTIMMMGDFFSNQFE